MAALGALSTLGLIVFIVWLIISAIRKRKKKTPLIGLIACFIIFCIAVGNTGTSGKSDNQVKDETSAPTQPVTLATAQTSTSSDAPEVSNTEKPSAPPPKAAKTWQKVIDFKGNSIKTTQKFTISSDEWKIKWSTTPGTYGDMNFQIYLYDGNGNLAGSGVLANIIGKGSDESFIYESGEYYLMINTAQNYTITVEENK